MSVLPEGPVVLPFKSEKLSFSLDAGTAGPACAVELSAICFDREGDVLDYIQFNKFTAFGGSLKHARCPQVPAGDEVAYPEAIHMYPFDFAPQCELVLLLASAPRSQVRRSDLSVGGKLAFQVHAREMGKTQVEALNVDLLPLVRGQAPGVGRHPLSNGHQTMVLAGLYTTPQGWTLSCDGTTYPADSWGLLLPSLKTLMRRWPFLSAAEHAVIRPNELVLATRRAVDASLEELAVAHQAMAEGPGAPSSAAPTTSTSTNLLAELEAAAAAAAAPPPPPPGAPTKLCLELGWDLWKGKGEEDEDPTVEFALTMYDTKNEEVGAVNGDATEAEGLAVDEPIEEPAGEEEEEAAEEEEGEEDPDEEAAAAKAAAKAAAEAAKAAKAAAAAAVKKALPIAFPLRRKVHITLAELPKAARSLVLTISNFSGSGFKRIKTLAVRITTEGQPGGNIPLADFRLDSAEGADAAMTQALVLKVYREYGDSAWGAWRRQGLADVDTLQHIPAPQDLMGNMLEAAKKLAAEVAVAKAKAEEEGESFEEDEPGPDLRLGAAPWRLRTLGVLAGGDGPELMEEQLKNVLSYDGALDAEGRRCDTAAKATYPSRDTYFGGYASDAKEGPGLYLFASGAVYLGGYEAGKRSGRGLLLLPDGGLYSGQFKADRFDGQGTYKYPDGSHYDGSWQGGKKHGPGTYWDATGGCLAGDWVGGVLAGEGRYDQAHYHFEGKFVKGIPAGTCAFTLAAFRSSDLPLTAGGYRLAEWGPTLQAQGQYSIPAAAAAAAEAPPPEEGAEGGSGEGGEEEEGPNAMPKFPNYNNLGYVSGDTLPVSAPDVAFPPAIAAN